MHTKEIYQYIVTHIYKDKTFIDIEETFTLTKGTINANLKKIFGELPKCDQHMRFIRKCNACDKKLIEWKKRAQEIIDSTNFTSHVEYSERISAIKENTKQKKIEEQLEQKHLALPKEIYEKTMEILLQNSFCGNQLKIMFEQISRYYIIEFFIAYEFKEKNSFPFPLLEYFFSIPPNLIVIKKISTILPYNQMTTQLLYTLKDIYALYTITKNKTVSSLFPILLAMHTKIFYTTHSLQGITAALVYIILMEQKMPISQHTLANIFDATEMTIRARMKQMKILLENDDMEVMEYFNALKKFEYKIR
jgi:AraC-like DNA-binding protein